MIQPLRSAIRPPVTTVSLRRSRAVPANTTASLAVHVAGHDLDHVGQIARVMAKVYGDEVGPWRAYVSILNDRRPVSR